MNITKWNVWHNYSSYFINDKIDLELAANKLINNQLCRIVCHTDGSVYWLDNGKLNKEFAKITPIGYTRKTEFQLNSKLDKSYALEGFMQYVQMKAAELDIYSDEITEDLPYIRGFLELFTIGVNDKLILLYPQVKIYSNGVFIVSFRILSPPDFKYPIENLIDNEINLFRHTTTDIAMPSSVIKLFFESTHFL